MVELITHYKIKEQDVVDFANSQGIRAKRIGDECAFLYCPYCRGGSSRDKWTFYVNTKTGQYECKRSSCGVKGNMITLARDFDFNLSDEFSAYYRKRPTYRNLPQPKSEIIPKPAAVSYLEQRGISEETAKAYKVTVQTDKESVMCFPVYDENGKMVNVKYRNLNYTKDKKNGIKEWYEQNCIPYLYGIQTWDGTYDRMILTKDSLMRWLVMSPASQIASAFPVVRRDSLGIPHLTNSYRSSRRWSSSAIMRTER